MCAKVLITGEIPQKGIEMLAKKHEVEIYKGRELIGESELRKRAEDKDALLTILSTPVDSKTIASIPNLKVIANYGAGFDNIDIEYAAEKGIPVSNTPVVSTETTADLTMGLIIAVARRITEGDRLCRTTGFDGWAPLFHRGRDVHGKKLGIIGFGDIGQAVARRAHHGFNMDIIYYDLEEKDAAANVNGQLVELEDLLAEADFVSINSSYNPQMKHMIAEKELGLMKDTAYLINAARGPIVKEKALVEALKNDNIAGAALDVFEFEPEIGDNLKESDNTVLTPHIGNATVETREAMAEIAARNIIAVLEGNEAPDCINL